MKTCILVEIDLQVYICVPKARFIWPKGIHFFTFCDLLDGTRKSRGNVKIQVGTRTRCSKKILKICIFASFQGDLACSWPGIKATNSFLTYPAKTLYFGLHGVHLEFCAKIVKIFALLNFILKTVLNVWRAINVFYRANLSLFQMGYSLKHCCKYLQRY